MTRIEQYQEEILKLANRFFPGDPEEAAMTLSIRQIQSLSDITGLTPMEILGIEPPKPAKCKRIDPPAFCTAIKRHLQAAPTWKFQVG